MVDARLLAQCHSVFFHPQLPFFAPFGLIIVRKSRSEKWPVSKACDCKAIKFWRIGQMLAMQNSQLKLTVQINMEDCLFLPPKKGMRNWLIILGCWMAASTMAYSAPQTNQRLRELRPVHLSLAGLSSPKSIWNYQNHDASNQWINSPVVMYIDIHQQWLMGQYYSHTSKLFLSPYAQPSRWDKPRKTMIHALSLKYRTPNYGQIRYNPVYLSANYLPNTNTSRLYGTKQLELNSFNAPAPALLEKASNQLIFKNPSLVRHQWDKIPSPHRFVMEGVLLDKKAAQEAFQIATLDVNRKLEKPKVTKPKWTYTGVEALQLSQTYFSNWVKGGQNSVTLLSDLRATANYKQGKVEWDNKGIHKVGILNSQGERSRIVDDLIQISSKAGLNASKKWYYSTLFDFKSQFFYGRDKKDWNKILSGFMSPAYLTFAVGMDYKTKDFTLMLSPITSKTTLVLDTINVPKSRYNIPDGKRSYSQTGASLNSSFKKKINTEFSLTSNFDLFYGYMAGQPQTQMDWELIFDMRINKYLSTRLNPTFRFYDSESSKLQWKENFSVVFSYKFPQK